MIAEGTLQAYHGRTLANGVRQHLTFRVLSEREAAVTLAVIAKSDLLLDAMGGEVITSSYAGLEVYREGDWEEWYGTDDDGDIDEWADAHEIWTQMQFADE